MPFQSTDALDDQPVIDGNTTFSGGLVSATRPDNIPGTAYADALNMDYDSFGVLESRVGCTSLLGAVETRNHEDIPATHASLTVLLRHIGTGAGCSSPHDCRKPQAVLWNPVRGLDADCRGNV